MTLSVIIPVYKVEEWICECLDSLACQDISDWDSIEVILVDDASPDGSMIKVESFVESYQGPMKLKVLRHEANKGLSEARNTAIREADGEYILFLDSDDMLAPGCLQRFAIAARRYPEAEIIYGYTKCFPEETSEQERYYRYDRRFAPRYTRFAWSARHWSLRLPEIAPNKLIKRDWLLKNNLFFEPGMVHEDTLWTLLAREHLRHIATLPCSMPTMLYRQRGGSITTEEDKDKRIEQTAQVYTMASRRIKHWDLQLAKEFDRKLRTLRESGRQDLLCQLTSAIFNNPSITHFPRRYLSGWLKT